MDEKIIDLSEVKPPYRVTVNSPHDCGDLTSPPPFRDQKCRCNSLRCWWVVDTVCGKDTTYWRCSECGVSDEPCRHAHSASSELPK